MQCHKVNCLSSQKLRYLSVALLIGLPMAACWPSSFGGMRGGERPDPAPGRMPGPGGIDNSGSPPEVTPAPTATPGGSAEVSYSREIQPILDRDCVGCHGGQAGLFMDSYDNLMAGSAGGKVVIAGDPDGSLLVRSIRGDGRSRMPPGGAGLTSSEIQLLVTWIAEGAPNN